MILPKEGLQYLNSIAHEGKVLVFGTDTTGRIHYTVKQDGFEDNYGSTELKGWENWQVLPLPNEDDDPSVIAKETEEKTIAGTTDFILRSRYRTHHLTAPAP